MKKVNNPPNLTHDPVATYVELVRVAEALHSSVSRGLAKEGLTASQFSTLKVLKYRGAIPQKDIATYLLKTGGNVTVVVDNLEKQGLVRRDRHLKDRRLVLVSLSKSGEALFDSVYPDHLERIKSVMRPLNEAQLEVLNGLLHELHTTVVQPVCLPAVEIESPASRRRRTAS